MDFLELLMCAYSQYLSEDSMCESMLWDDVILDSTVPSIFVVLCVAMFAAACMPQVSRDCWKLQRDGILWESLKILALTGEPSTRDREWRKFYRMSFSSFQHLVTELRPYIENPSNEFVREPIETEKAVAVVLHRLASGTSPRVLAEMYNTGASTVTKYTKLITSVLASSSQLYSKYVVIPSGSTLEENMEKFRSLTGISNICGAIAGTHIKLYNKPKPAYSPSDYLSSHGIYSVLLQGVCDSDKMFWDVCCNAPGGLDDSSHLRGSSLWRKLTCGEILQRSENIEKVPAFIVGDTTYPLMPFLITPFSSGKEAEAEYAYNLQLQKATQTITSAFSLLKRRWRILKNMNTDLKYVAQVVMACCVLHNFCQIAGEPETTTEAETGEEGDDDDDDRMQIDEYPGNKIPGPPLTLESEVQLQREGIDCRLASFWDWFHYQHQQANPFV